MFYLFAKVALQMRKQQIFTIGALPHENNATRPISILDPLDAGKVLLSHWIEHALRTCANQRMQRQRNDEVPWSFERTQCMARPGLKKQTIDVLTDAVFVEHVQHDLLQQVLHRRRQVDGAVLVDARRHLGVDHPALELADGEAESAARRLAQFVRVSAHGVQRRRLVARRQARVRQRPRQHELQRRLDLVASAAAPGGAEALRLPRYARQRPLEQVGETLHDLHRDVAAVLLSPSFPQYVQDLLVPPWRAFQLRQRRVTIKRRVVILHSQVGIDGLQAVSTFVVVMTTGVEVGVVVEVAGADVMAVRGRGVGDRGVAGRAVALRLASAVLQQTRKGRVKYAEGDSSLVLDADVKDRVPVKVNVCRVVPLTIVEEHKA